MNEPHSPPDTPPWLRGALISCAGVLIGTVALTLFCYTLGLNFSDEGWPAGRPDVWQTNRPALLVAFAGFAISILLFWIGLNQAIRAAGK